jgi:hypothetical protein
MRINGDEPTSASSATTRPTAMQRDGRPRRRCIAADATRLEVSLLIMRRSLLVQVQAAHNEPANSF